MNLLTWALLGGVVYLALKPRPLDPPALLTGMGAVTVTSVPPLGIHAPLPDAPPVDLAPVLRASPYPPLGDVNADGFVTDADAALALQSWSGLATLTPAQLQAADVNRDGQIDAVDALGIRRYAAGLSDHF